MTASARGEYISSQLVSQRYPASVVAAGSNRTVNC